MQAPKSVFLALLLLSACAHGPSLSSAQNPFAATEAAQKPSSLIPFRLAFTSHVIGEVGECGCAVNPKGGADRRLNFVRKESKSSDNGPLLVVDAGNALFPNERLDAGQAALQKKKASFLLESEALMSVRVQNVGGLDLSAGVEFLKSEARKAGVPLVSSNLLGPDERTVFDASRHLEIPNGPKVMVFGLTLGSSALPDGLKVMDPKQALLTGLAGVPADELVIVLSDLGQAMDAELAMAVDRPVIFVGARDHSGLDIPLLKNQSLLVQPQIQGQQWGVLDLQWNPKGRGWYSASVAELYAKRWKALSKDDSKESQESRHELALYAPGDFTKKSIYEQRLVDMTLEYATRNELSKTVSALSNDRRD